MNDREIKGYKEFEFDLPRALLASLIKLLDHMEAGSLGGSTLDELPDAQGVYQLLHAQQIVYIGKTDLGRP